MINKLPEVLTLVEWRDNDDGRIVDVRDRYVEKYWLPILGPSCIWFLRSAVDHLAHRECVTLPTEAFSMSLGLRSNALAKAVDRLVKFNQIQVRDNTIAVPFKLPMLHNGQVARLPQFLQMSHATIREAIRASDMA
jgi:hypothetical protein